MFIYCSLRDWKVSEIAEIGKCQKLLLILYFKSRDAVYRLYSGKRNKQSKQNKF